MPAPMWRTPPIPVSTTAPAAPTVRNVENIVLVAQSNFKLNRAASLLVNGWELAPLVHIVSGAPFTVTAGQDVLPDGCGQRPSQPGSGSLAPTCTRRFFLAQVRQIAASSLSRLRSKHQRRLGTYGNVSRNSFRGTTAYQFDSQISRTFPIHESLNAVFRFEAFNVLNHPNFNLPTETSVGTLGGTTGGSAVLTSSTSARSQPRPTRPESSRDRSRSTSNRQLRLRLAV